MSRAKRIGLGLSFGMGILLILAGVFYLRQLANGEETHIVQGRVVGFGGLSTLYIEHGEVSGFLPAATTPFQADDSFPLDSLEVGDAVQVAVVSGSREFGVTGIERLPDNAIPRNPALPVGTQEAISGNTAIDVGEEVPDVTLTNQDGEAVRFGDYSGRLLVLTFIYTNCPLPNFCPLMSENFARMQPELKAAYGTDVQFLSISFDPKNDTPQVLSNYAARYTDDFSNWTFATPTAEEGLEKAKEAFGITTFEQEGQIMHNLTTALIGTDGKLVWLWRGNTWTPEDIFNVIEETAASQNAFSIQPDNP